VESYVGGCLRGILGRGIELPGCLRLSEWCLADWKTSRKGIYWI